MQIPIPPQPPPLSSADEPRKNPLPHWVPGRDICWTLICIKWIQLKVMAICIFVFALLVPLLTAIEAAAIRIPIDASSLFLQHYRDTSLFWQSTGLIIFDLALFAGAFMDAGKTVRFSLGFRTFQLNRFATSVGILVVVKVIIVLLIMGCVPLDKTEMFVVLQLSGWPGGFLIQNILMMTHIPYPRRILQALLINVATIVIGVCVFWLPTLILFLGSLASGIAGSIVKTILGTITLTLLKAGFLRFVNIQLKTLAVNHAETAEDEKERKHALNRMSVVEKVISSETKTVNMLRSAVVSKTISGQKVIPTPIDEEEQLTLDSTLLRQPHSVEEFFYLSAILSVMSDTVIMYVIDRMEFMNQQKKMAVTDICESGSQINIQSPSIQRAFERISGDNIVEMTGQHITVIISAVIIYIFSSSDTPYIPVTDLKDKPTELIYAVGSSGHKEMCNVLASTLSSMKSRIDIANHLPDIFLIKRQSKQAVVGTLALTLLKAGVIRAFNVHHKTVAANHFETAEDDNERKKALKRLSIIEKVIVCETKAVKLLKSTVVDTVNSGHKVYPERTAEEAYFTVVSSEPTLTSTSSLPQYSSTESKSLTSTVEMEDASLQKVLILCQRSKQETQLHLEKMNTKQESDNTRNSFRRNAIFSYSCIKVVTWVLLLRQQQKEESLFYLSATLSVTGDTLIMFFFDRMAFMAAQRIKNASATSVIDESNSVGAVASSLSLHAIQREFERISMENLAEMAGQHIPVIFSADIFSPLQIRYTSR
ncbi:hypothetical protein HDV05_001739 [Chytridiales sp. JEL 0842]|nr:hypothetical protein HDV05_001739 [Chytridiales sp. JEL 0842]